MWKSRRSKRLSMSNKSLRNAKEPDLVRLSTRSPGREWIPGNTPVVGGGPSTGAWRDRRGRRLWERGGRWEGGRGWHTIRSSTKASSVLDGNPGTRAPGPRNPGPRRSFFLFLFGRELFFEKKILSVIPLYLAFCVVWVLLSLLNFTKVSCEG